MYESDARGRERGVGLVLHSLYRLHPSLLSSFSFYFFTDEKVELVEGVAGRGHMIGDV